LRAGCASPDSAGASPLTRLLIWKKTEGEELRLVETNQSFLEVFFARPVSDGSLRSGSMVTERFFLPKPKGTFRIIMIGESTIQGFPMPRNLTSSAFLQEYLRRSMPGRDVEVLNFGATAAASFPIRKIGEEAMKELEPDALVVYGAHNEFFGASGMASFQRLGTSVAMMQFSWRLRKTGMVSALQWSMTRLAKKKAKEEAKKEDRTLIEIMAGTDYVEPGGPLHEQARRSLETNWDALRQAGLTRGVPVIFCTVASNEAGMAPMVSSGTGLSPEVMKELNALLEKPAPTADAAWKDRAAELDAMLKRAPGHALLNYRAAEANQKAGRKAEALKLYQQARDLDALPWRAASDKNEVIRGVAQREGAHLADAAAAFEKEAGGATDWLLFDDPRASLAARAGAPRRDDRTHHDGRRASPRRLRQGRVPPGLGNLVGGPRCPSPRALPRHQHDDLHLQEPADAPEQRGRLPEVRGTPEGDDCLRRSLRDGCTLALERRGPGHPRVRAHLVLRPRRRPSPVPP
jgi:hypothetical protein